VTPIVLNRKEALNLYQWVRIHACGQNPGPLDLFYLIAPPGAHGPGLQVVCKHCEEEKDLTDYGAF
jgi:hypothetical protein